MGILRVHSLDGRASAPREEIPGFGYSRLFNYHIFPTQQFSRSRTARASKICRKNYRSHHHPDPYHKTAPFHPPHHQQVPFRHDQDTASARQGSRDGVHSKYVQGIGQFSCRTGPVRNAHVRHLRGLQDGDAQEIPGGCCVLRARAHAERVPFCSGTIDRRGLHLVP